jgi:hypothetical protein
MPGLLYGYYSHIGPLGRTRRTARLLSPLGGDDCAGSRARERAGRGGYDYKLAAGTDALPYVGTSYYSYSTPLGTIGVKDQFIAEPCHLMVSPHAEIGVILGGGAEAYSRMKRTHVLGPGAKRELA